MAALRITFPPLLAAVLALSSCAPAPPRDSDSEHLLTGAHTPIPLTQIDAASDLARRFASAYARSIYSPDPPSLPGATPEVTAALRVAVERIPPQRLGHRPHAGGLHLEPLSSTRLRASVAITDSVSPSFSVGFEIERRPTGWRVTSMSAPG